MKDAIKPGEAATIARSDVPLTRSSLTAALRDAHVSDGDVVIVHSSLSKLGWVVGGAHTIVLALQDAVGSSGTIVMPAQTAVSDPATWTNPPVPEEWWPTIRAEWPPYDPALTPLRAMGAVVDCFRGLPNVLHSGHPSVAFVAAGPRAAEITKNHPLEDSLADDSPLGDLYRADARVLLLGVGHGNNTSLHLAEHRSDYHGKRNTDHGAPLLVDGSREWVTYSDLDRDDEDFAALGAAFVEAGGTEHRVELGAGTVTSCSMREIVDFAVEWLRRTRKPSATA